MEASASSSELRLKPHCPSPRVDVGNRARRGHEGQNASKPTIEIVVTKRLLEGREGRLAGAMAGRQVIHSVRVMQKRNDPLDLCVIGHHEMKPTGEHMNPGVDLGR